MRIAIYGTGGAGGYFGARLALAGHDVTFIARGAHLEAIRASGLVLETPEGELTARPAKASDDPAALTDAEVVILGVKAWQVRAAGEALKPVLQPGAFVVPLQNGVEAADELTQVLGKGAVLGGLCVTFSWKSAPGRIRSIGGINAVRFAELDNRPSERVERLRQAFTAAGVKADVPADIHKALWEKFVIVTAFGGVGAVSRAPVGVMRTMPETRSLLEQCVAEAAAVARARGVALAQTAVADTMSSIDQAAPAATSSLQRDIADGKPSELDYWNGAVVRLGREAGIATPTHSFITDVLQPQERRARGDVTFPA